jgi:hypothetical protein
MEARLNLIAGDTLPTVFNCRNGSIALPLTGYSVSLKVNLNNSILTKNAVITNALNGVGEFRWLNTDFIKEGIFEAEFKITNASAQVVTSEKMLIVVKVGI